jgi:hypothetical protein
LNGYWRDGLQKSSNEGETMSLSQDANYTLTQDTNFYRCPYKEACQVHETTGTVTCAKGSGGPLCSVCDAGWHQSTDGACTICTAEEQFSSSEDIVEILVMALLAFVFVALYMLSGPVKKWTCCGILGHQSSLRRKLQGARPMFVTKSKIVVGFVQVMILSDRVYKIPSPPLVERFMAFFDPLMFDIFQLFYVDCVVQYDYYAKLLILTSVTFFMMAAAFSLDAFVDAYHTVRPDGTQSKTAERIINCVRLVRGYVPMILYFIYPKLCQTIFAAFICHHVGIGNYLYEDYQIDCDSSTHKLYRVYACFCVVVFGFGVPFLFWFLMKRMMFVNDERNQTFGVIQDIVSSVCNEIKEITMEVLATLGFDTKKKKAKNVETVFDKTVPSPLRSPSSKTRPLNADKSISATKLRRPLQRTLTSRSRLKRTHKMTDEPMDEEEL